MITLPFLDWINEALSGGNVSCKTSSKANRKVRKVCPASRQRCATKQQLSNTVSDGRWFDREAQTAARAPPDAPASTVDGVIMPSCSNTELTPI